MRTHVVIPRELIEEVDDLVGRRKRSQFLTEAVQEKLARMRLTRVAHELAGSLEDEDIPGWETSENAEQWVRSLRQTTDHWDSPPSNNETDDA